MPALTKKQKELHDLMAESPTIQSLTMTERLELEEQILALPIDAYKAFTTIFEAEKQRAEKLAEARDNEEKSATTIIKMTIELKDAGREVDRTFLFARETADRESQVAEASSLLDQISQL